MIRSFPRDREAKKRAIEALLMKHHVDIPRLWRNMPQIAQPGIGTPFTGPLVPVPFVFRQGGQSGSDASGIGNLCDATQVCFSISNIYERGTGTAGGPYGGADRCENFNRSYTLTRFSRLAMSGTAQPTCTFLLRGLPFSTNNRGMVVVSITRAPAGNPNSTYRVRLTFAIEVGDQGGVASVFAYYERIVSDRSSWPITVNLVNENIGHLCRGFPATITITECSSSGTSTGDIVGSGFTGNGCQECSESFSFTTTLPNPYDGCSTAALSGSWTVARVQDGYCEWDSGTVGTVSGSTGGVRWVMYRNGSVYTLSGFNYDCRTDPVITLSTLDPCTGTMEFLTEDALISITVNPA